MEKIVVAYWAGSFLAQTGIPHNTEFEYSEKKRNEIIDTVLHNNLNLMICQSDRTLIMWIDNGRFRQR